MTTFNLQDWVGREQTRQDWINPNTLASWQATLDRDDPFPAQGDPVPPGFHWTLFLPLDRRSDLGVDGHARRGGFLPPVALPRRMWAGGRLQFLAPLAVGDEVSRHSVIEKVDEKNGRNGPLVFVTVRHTLSTGGVVAVVEEHDIVYREAPAPDAPPAAPGPAAPRGPWERIIEPDDVLLFRYSALTFNSHRIHYDRRYVTTVEGYPGLVVHGPLIATLLLDLVRRQLPKASVSRFEFRALRPTFDTGPFALRGEPGADGQLRLWSTDNQGATSMEASAWVV